MPTRARTFRIVSFGCKVNQAEGLALAARLRELGLEETVAEDAVDLAVVNTCVVTAEAARQGRQGVRRAARLGAAVVVTGCGAHAAIRDTALRQVEGFWFVEPDKERIADRLRAAWPDAAPESACPPTQATARSRAMLKVQDGCPGDCAYCIVPKVRPDVRSTPIDEAVRQLEAFIGRGYREVVICGIHLGLYGADLGPRADLADLVERLLAVPGLGRLRLSSIEPMEVSDRLLALVRDEPERLCPHLHLPLQSGDDGVLRQMRRPYTRGDYLGAVARIRDALPLPAVTTDVLVGFPGETDEAFAQTLCILREAGFSRIHAFPFSRRPGTRAADMADQVPRETVRARREAASALGRELAAAYRAALVGRPARVVVETIHADGSAEGLSERYVRVRLRGPLPRGTAQHGILPVRLVGVAGDALEGEPDAA